MTIRYLLCVTAAIAFGFALMHWNFGISMLVLAAVPFVALLWLPRPSTRRKRFVRCTAALLAASPVYFLSFAPCLVAITPVDSPGPSPQWIYKLFTTTYAPHYYLAHNATTQRPFLEMIAPHVQAWEDIELKCRGLFRETDG